MIKDEIRKELELLAEPDYRDFSRKLTPGVEDMLGVRIPALRKLAKRIAKENYQSYLAEPEWSSFEERMLYGMVIGYGRMEFSERLHYLDVFIPCIDNWSVCDCCCSTYKFMQKYPKESFAYLKQKLAVDEEFTIRFAVVCMMDYFIDKEHITEVLSLYESIRHPGYYVKMAVAWGISVCYVKFQKETEAFLQNNRLDDFTQNKSIQKIRESNRVSKEDKARCLQWKR